MRSVVSILDPVKSQCSWSQGGTVVFPPRIGGVAAHQENAAKPPLKAQTGWSVQNDHPGRALLTFDGRVHPSYPGGDYSDARFQYYSLLLKPCLTHQGDVPPPDGGNVPVIAQDAQR